MAEYLTVNKKATKCRFCDKFYKLTANLFFSNLMKFNLCDLCLRGFISDLHDLSKQLQDALKEKDNG